MRYGMMCTLAAAVMVAATAWPAKAVEPGSTSSEVEKDSMAVQKVQYGHAPVRVTHHHCRPLLRRHHHVPVYRCVYRTHVRRHHWRPDCRPHGRIVQRHHHRCRSTRGIFVPGRRTVLRPRMW